MGKDNEGNTPPKIHNLIVILSGTRIEVNEDDKDFLRAMNQFQLEGRYPDYKDNIYKMYKSAKTKIIIDKVNTRRKWLLKNL